MQLPRISVGRSMIVISVVAVDCGLLREFVEGLHLNRAGEDLPALFRASGAFLLVNILALGLYRLASRSHTRRPFLVGFEVTGAVALIAYYVGSRLFLSAPLAAHVADLLDPIGVFSATVLFPLLFYGLAFGLPLVFVAVIGGLVAKRYSGPRPGSEAPPNLALQRTRPAAAFPEQSTVALGGPVR